MALSLAMGMSKMGFFSLAVLAPFLTVDLHLSHGGLGILTAVVFAISAVASPFAGQVTDRAGTRTTFYWLFATAALSLWLAAAASSFSWLVASVALAGIPAALANPVTNRVLAGHPVGSSQATLIGVKQSGVQMAALLAGFLVPAVALQLGWRGAMLATSGLAAVGIVATRAFIPQAKGIGIVGSRPRSTDASHSVIRWLTAYAFLMGAGVAAVVTYLPLYAHEALGLSVAAAGIVAGIVGLVGIAGRICWARASSAHPNAAILAVIAAVSVGATLSVGLAETHGVWLLWVGAVAFGLSGGSWNAVGAVILVRTVDTAIVGWASGRVIRGFYGGFIVAPIAFGYSVDAFANYAYGGGVICLTFAAAGVLALNRRRLPLNPS